MSSIDKLTELFKKFPGIGERQAKRFVYYLLHKNQNYLSELIDLIKNIKKEVVQCPSCCVYFSKDSSSFARGRLGEGRDESICNICLDETTDKSTLMIVEKDTDYENIRRSGFYHGLYFILGGFASPEFYAKAELTSAPDKNENRIRIKELLKTTEDKAKNGSLKEIIISLSLTPQGEFTENYIRNKLAPLAEKYDIKISTLGRGLSTGLELEYSDPETIKNALQNRN